MNNSGQDWEKEFSSFERDIDMPLGINIPNSDLSLSDFEMDFDLSDSLPKKEPTSSVSSDTSDVLAEEPPITPDLLQEPIEEPSGEEETSERDTEQPLRVHPPLTTYDMVMLRSKLMDSIDAAVPLRDQTKRMVTDHNDIKLPKGLRTTASLISDITDVLIATKAILDLFLSLRVRPLYQSIEEYQLKTAMTSTIRTLKAHIPTMQEGLNDVEKAMGEGYDRPSANLRLRIVKAQAKNAHSFAVQQAQALAQTIEFFPLEDGALRVLCLLQEKGDQAMMSSMDRAMDIAEHVQVPVADAPAMLEAVHKNDQDTVDAIIRKKLQTQKS